MCQTVRGQINDLKNPLLCSRQAVLGHPNRKEPAAGRVAVRAGAALESGEVGGSAVTSASAGALIGPRRGCERRDWPLR